MNNIRLETIVTLPLRQGVAKLSTFFQELYDTGKRSFERQGITDSTKLLEEIDTFWKGKDPIFFPKKIPDHSLGNSWQLTDFVLVVYRDRLVFGLERGRKDENFQVTANELIGEIVNLLQKLRRLLERANGIQSQDSTQPIGLTIAIEGDRLPTTLENRAKTWAERELRSLFQTTFGPAFQEGTPENRESFFATLTGSGNSDRNSLSWAASTKGDCMTWSCAGFRQLTRSTSEQKGKKANVAADKAPIPVYMMFWANQGNPWRNVLSSNRPYFPAQRGVVLDRAWLTAQGDLKCLEIHRELQRAERGLKLAKSGDFARAEERLISARAWIANIQRYRIDVVNSLMELGVSTSRNEPHDLLDYMDQTISQLQIEIDRFGPELERVIAVHERAGGVLGWPGFVLATAAILLSALDAWWGIASSYNQDRVQQLDFFAKASMYSVAGCVMVTGFVLIFVLLNEIRRARLELSRTTKSRISIIFSLMGRPSLLMLLFAAILSIAIAIATFSSSFALL